MQHKGENGNNLRRHALSYSGLPQFSPPPPAPAFLASSASINSGVAMNMSDMQSSIRGFAHHHPQQPVAASDSSFWRQSSSVEAQQASYKPSGLDIEFNDFLSTPSAPSSRESSSANPLHTVGETAADDVSMADVGASFQLPSSAFASLNSVSSVAPLGLAHRQLAGTQAPSASASPTSDASSSRSASAAMGTSVARPAVPVTATAGTNDYSRFVDSADEPDLSQHKIEQKNEKCQFHNCPNRARVSQAYGKFCNRHVIVAPCGFPGCRDKALLHSSMCDKHLAEGKDALHRILANRAQNVPVCRTFGCFKNDQGRGYCRGHEKLLMATGRLPKHINKRRLNSAYTMCSYPNCNKHSQRNHLCRTHGNVVLKQAEEIVRSATTGESFEDVLARLQKEIRRCTHPTCTKNSQRDRLCTMHYYEKHNLQRDSSGARDTDSQLSSTDGGGESDLETAVCSIDGCNLHAFSKRGLCKFHSGELSTSAASSSSTPAGKSIEPSVGRQRSTCSIPGCGKLAPYASGLCAHHGNKTNQAIQITRMSPLSPAVSTAVCGAKACTSSALPGSVLCEYHTTQRRVQPGDSAAGRPSLGDTSAYSNQSSHSFLPAPSPDPTGVFAGFEGFASLSTGATGRMASLNVSSSATVAEHDARQALVNLNSSNRSSSEGDRPAFSSASSSTCSNPMCTRESYGRDYCEPCMSVFSPLVVSVGDSSNSSNNNPYQFASLSHIPSNQSLQPEPEGETMWEDGVEAKGTKPRDECRANDCGAAVSRFGLCDDHVRLFQSGSLSVDEITLRSRQVREQKEREAADAALAAAADMKHAGSPRVKKYFCKVDGCDKQAQKRGLCKRHFRVQELGGSSHRLSQGHSPGSSLDESNNQHFDAMADDQCCRFPACGESVAAATTLCPSHSTASFCCQAGCETLVESPQFCDYHSYRRECGYEGCAFTATGDSSGCATHAMERRCSHAHCAHFALARTDRCRLHVDDCGQQPCALCELYGASSARGGYGTGRSDSKSEFANERELARRSAFSDSGRRL